MKPIMAGHVSWLAPADTALEDWVLLPSTTATPTHWAQVTALESHYTGELRAVLAHQKSAPTNKQIKELTNLVSPT